MQAQEYKKENKENNQPVLRIRKTSLDDNDEENHLNEGTLKRFATLPTKKHEINVIKDDDYIINSP